MGQGQEDIQQNQAPILKIFQRASAEVDETHKDHELKKVPGAKAGDIFFISEGKVFTEGVEVIPLAQETIYVEWRLKSQGGGIVAHHKQTIITNPAYRKGTGDNKYKEYLGENELKLTMYFFVLAKVNDEWKRAILPFASSNLALARGWGRKIRNFRYPGTEDIKPPIFAQTWLLGTSLKRGDENSWYEFTLTENKTLDFKEDKDLLLLAANARQDATETLPQAQTQAQIETHAQLTDEDEDAPF